MNTAVSTALEHQPNIRLLDVCTGNNLPTGNDRPRTAHRIFHRRDILTYTGETFKGVYILRSGSAKSFVTADNGDEQINCFYYPGDLIGLDGFDNRCHMQNVQFLETSSVCFVKESEINVLLQTSDDFRRCFLQTMSHALVCESAMIMSLSTCSSEQRVVQFILDLSKRFATQGLSGKEYHLSMTRTDIANYLGMAIETVSRIFTNLQVKNIILVKNRQLNILNYQGLKALLQAEPCSS
ncbi:helix-turn-helix domain-containing protein [Aliiglaciecola sp. LCG003]|uniref:helix-turn-helix domain-containing protein n=1 Tax=Aliiglaciecola sp. LCG003 TaxID=3053655 RepID=UPI002572EC6A|nr:helix-turn-helix domain-containing protein [Aliiglaciecola sp. LCG003]WJG07686.1 helix-turn-helix domain-containing protein [Aliiglaciecola sp. LCG003]